jgi:phosphoribosylformylglycinamidine synthase PurS subunit
MRFRAKIEVILKHGHSDPEGDTITRALRELSYPVKGVSVSKVYTVVLEADSKTNAENLVDEMCRRLLANPTKDDYKFEIWETK